MNITLSKCIHTLAASLVALCLTTSTPAAQFQLTYTGYFNAADALNLASESLDPFDGLTAFTASSLFDNTSPNLVAPIGIPGFVAYAPIQTTLTIGGTVYDVQGYTENPSTGIAVSIFDRTTPFVPGAYGVGFIQNPLADGAGIVGDWSSANPNFTAGNLTATEWVSYNGAGFLAGIGGAPTPWVLRDGDGAVYSLTIGNRTEEYRDGAPLHTAELEQVVPEPGTFGLGAFALASLIYLKRSRP